MKILIINYEFPPLGGGGGVASFDLALEWAKHGQVDVLTSTFGDLPAFETVEGINIHRVKVLFRKSRDAASFPSMLSYLFTGFAAGLRLMRANRYDVINTHFAVPSGPLGYILGKMFKVPNVLSIHGGDIYDPSKKTSPHRSRIFRAVVRFILKRADEVVAQSSNTRDNAVKYYQPPKEVMIIPLAFHPPKIKKAGRKGLELRDDEFIMITVGRLVKRKAVDVQIEALSKLKSKDIRLIVMGDGPEMDYLIEKSLELGVSDRITFTGYLSDKEKFSYLSAADLFVMTSLHEGFGIVFMEAMNYGLPIVSTNHGGQVDFLTHEENALLINVGDVEGCAESISRFMSDSVLYRKCSKNNMAKVKQFYAEAVAGRYSDVFMSLAEKRRGKGKRQ